MSKEIENARKVLRDAGFFVDNLWSVNDVKGKFECTDEEAQEVLDMALQNDVTMNQIWFSIACAGEEKDLDRLQVTECCGERPVPCMIDTDGTNLAEGAKCPDCGEEDPELRDA